MLLEHERNEGFGMDALDCACSWNTNGIMVLAWMLWSAYALEKHDVAAYAGGRAKVLENPRQNTRRGPTTRWMTA